MGEPREKVVFEQTVAALFVHALRHKRTARFADRLKSAGIALDAKLHTAYPFEVWRECLSIAAEEVFPGDPLDQAMFKLGKLFLEGYRETFMGRALFPLLRVIGTRRALQRVARSFRTGNNYTEIKLTEISPGCFELWVNAIAHPMFATGILHVGMAAAGASSSVVELVSQHELECTLRVTWAEHGS